MNFLTAGGIYDDPNTFPGLTLSSDNYEEKFRISRFHRPAKQMGEPLALGAPLALSSELGKLMLVDRIPSPDALYGASILAQTFEPSPQVVLNPIDFADVTDVNIAKSVKNIKFPHIG